MRWTQAGDKQVDKFGAGKHGFTEGNQGTGVDATDVDAEDMDGPMVEVVSTIEASQQTPASVETDAPQLPTAVQILAAGRMRGFRSGTFVRTSDSVITLQPAFGDKVYVEIDGLAHQASSLAWDTTTDLDSGAVAADTIYYLYALLVGGALDTKLSATPPATSGKVGYHPVRTSERCLFAMATKSGSTAWKGFDESPDGWTLLRAPDHVEYVLGGTRPTTYQLFALSGVPATARAVRLNAHTKADDVQHHYAHEALVGGGAVSVSANKSGNRLGALEEGTNNVTDSKQFELAVDATPALAWGVIEFPGSSPQVHVHEVVLVGWRNAL